MIRFTGTASRFGAVLVAGSLATACGTAGGSAGGRTSAPAERPAPAPSTSSPPASEPAPTGTSTGTTSEVDRVLADMSLSDKVGQLFMPVLYGASADASSGENQSRYGVATPAKAIKKYRPGGVIVFPWAGNVKSVGQIVGLTNGMQQASPEIPLLVAADQENGTVSRLAPLVTKLPAAAVIGKTGDPRLARQAAEVTGTELRALGINLDFAPVADVNINPRNPVIGPRSYGNDPQKVSRMVAAAVRGFHDAGVASTAKHFPGHGDTNVDSHSGLPVIAHTRSQWAKLDAPPFAAAIKAGVDAVMSAHVVMPKLDSSGDPSTLSPKILTGLLRERLGFDGVVSTDALDMAGVRKKYGDGEVAVRAVLAGADLLLMPPDLPEAHAAVIKAVKSGRISQERLDQSVRRLLTLKAARGLLESAPRADAAEAARVIGSAEHRRVAQRIEQRAGG
ncbi:beta-hexosaminidase [Spongiactinospora rosea]|uniref:beta-N-acetylhexosaminidase n=1 Tax=Spongiactinospora rosea TaxID=2248750 RepID=A0A366LUL9_9ACTN|nr:glycoside hydrolase family 3 protein [Spongiactinospora rosea]RBQ17049.1 beta-hexosaminidase [Spongiactinospora rosea]